MFASATGATDRRFEAGRVHGCLGGHCHRVAYFGTFSNEVIAIDIAAKKVKWRFEDPDRQFQVLLVGGICFGHGRRRWPR